MSQAEINPTRATREKYWIIVPAAGVGRRMGAEVAKQYLRIGQATILELTLDRLSRLRNIEEIVLVLHPEDSSWKFLHHERYTNVTTVSGDDERYKSVLKGLAYLEPLAAEQDWVLVHDAVRPCVREADIHRLMALSSDSVGGLLAAPVRETIKQVSSGVVERTVPREQLWLAATPQMFRYGILRRALHRAIDAGIQVTDEASAVEALGLRVKVVPGHPDNIKVTHPEDLALVAAILAAGQIL